MSNGYRMAVMISSLMLFCTVQKEMIKNCTYIQRSMLHDFDGTCLQCCGDISAQSMRSNDQTNEPDRKEGQAEPCVAQYDHLVRGRCIPPELFKFIGCQRRFCLL
jgi:hypothetical protein